LKQTTDTVIMVAPREFESNPEAGADNHFAEVGAAFDKGLIVQEAALLRDALIAAGVNVIEIDPAETSPAPEAPDGCFPNNWLMFVDGKAILCPMKAPSRRRERAMWPNVSLRLREEGYHLGGTVDLTAMEAEVQFLEGTGSLVLDRVHRIAYAALSERTSHTAAEQVAELLDYRLVAFEATDPGGRAIYHTNVIMSIGSKFAVLCPESVAPASLRRVRESLMEFRELIEVSWDQVRHYCGNVLELSTDSGSAIVAMSKTAHNAFTAEQIEAFRRCGAEPVNAEISTIERVAGGSVRCMLAEVFLCR
jgi:hypothetical protein